MAEAALRAPSVRRRHRLQGVDATGRSFLHRLDDPKAQVEIAPYPLPFV
jgi:hypothetical protein